jgi:hypothetical protein
MTAKRTPLERRRTPRIDDETLRLFTELEHAPLQHRKSDDFKQRDRELARRLGLGGEWLCSVASVTNRKRTSYYREGSPQREDWLRVRAVRNQLLAAAGMSTQRPRRARAN